MSERDEFPPQLWLTEQRYYMLQVQLNLFGDWELLKAWGGRGSRRGGYRVMPAQDAGQAMTFLNTESHRRARRGYWPVSSPASRNEGEGT